MPVIRFTVDVLQHNKLRQGQERIAVNMGMPTRSTRTFHHFSADSAEKHVGKIAGNHKEDLHAKGMDEVVK